MLPCPERMYGRPAIRISVVMLLAGALVARPAAQAPRPEVAIKTEFVLRFPEFVEWPAPGPEQRPLSLCLSPAHPFGQSVHESVSLRPRAQRIVVHELRNRASLRTCNIVYVAPADLSLLDEIADLPILTVGDQPNFCQRGGMINLLVVDGRVRFEIDLSRAKRAGLKLDSQLLRLASKVYGGRS